MHAIRPRGASEPLSRSVSVRCCIVGGGPAGMMLGYLLGRAGIQTLVLEKHADFLRDFRGDTVHPSTLEIMDELGLLGDFLKLPHQELSRLSGQFGAATLRVADLTRLKLKCPFIAFMPQWDFLDFLLDKGRRFSGLEVMQSAEVTGLIRNGDAVTGVIARTADGTLRVNADLTIGCDGRHSIVRQCAGLAVEDIGAPIDVLWFRVGKGAAVDAALLHAEQGHMLVTLDRGDYLQCAYIIAKGQYETVKAAGLQAFRAAVVATVPALGAHIDDIRSWDDIKLLTVTIDRLTQWSQPGLLCIGDAAHAMSPVGGVGINLAIQDAVATANILTGALRKGAPSPALLDAVRRRRLWPVQVIQAVQVQVQNRIINRALAEGPMRPPALLRMIDAWPFLQGLTARLLAVGVRPERVRSPP